MKMDEDEIALSESDDSGVVVEDLAEWCTAVASKLQECAVELETLCSPLESDSSVHFVDGNESVEVESEIEQDVLQKSDHLLEGIIEPSFSAESNSTTRQRSVSKASISTLDEALPKSTHLTASKADKLLKKMKDSHFMRKEYSQSSNYASGRVATMDEEKKDEQKKHSALFTMLILISLSTALFLFSSHENVSSFMRLTSQKIFLI